MKSRHLPFGFLALILGGVAFIFLAASRERPEDQQRAEGARSFVKAKEFLSQVRNNQATGILDPRDVLAARDKARSEAGLKSGAALELNWTSMGPQNQGGRCRALIFDNRDGEANTIYASGVAGGIYKSTNLAATWNKLDLPADISNLKVTCMTQGSDGTIYLGTGEGFHVENYTSFSNLGYTSGFVGSGLYMIGSGDQVSLVEGTEPLPNQADAEWAYISEVAVGSDGKLWAATNTGLKVKTSEGWIYAQYSDSTGTFDLLSNAQDVKAASDGLIVAAVDGKGYVSVNGAPGEFICFSTGEEEMLPATGIGRIELAISPSDPAVVYALAAKSGDKSLENVYLTEDRCASWRVIGPGGSMSLNILGAVSTDGLEYFQGDFANTITVFPNNSYRILAGGANMWEGKKINETGYFQWLQKSEGEANFTFSPLYVHTDHHQYVFRPGYPNEMFIATDGGIYKATLSGENITFEVFNTNLITSQFYTLGISGDPEHLLGGAQDLGTIYLRPQNNIMYGSDIWTFGP
ncbi:MAG: hypothetical protein JW861_03730, partial [Bacteroidales bacterium]|nr:hypothetical protein [Bacteroidales bacterium]